MNRKRSDYSGQVLHAMNRAVEGKTLFHTYEDYALFTTLLSTAVQRHNMRLLEWVLMPNHWHLLLHPERKMQVPDFMQWLTGNHAKILRRDSDTTGKGAVYQGRYRATFIEPGLSLNRARNYLSMNPVKAYLTDRPAEWQWGSAARLLNEKHKSVITLSKGPRPYPHDIEKILTDPMYLNPDQRSRIKNAFKKENPYGGNKWKMKICELYNIPKNAKRVGRPYKK